jgi:cytochrome c oxidase subunit 1
MPRTNPLRLPPRHYLNNGYGVGSWLLTRDHKRIALLYLAGVTLFFFIGGAFAVMIRLELATPVENDTTIPRNKLHAARRDDGLLLPHPGDTGGARQLPDPLIGAKDLAFPKLNLASWYIT